MDYSVYYTGKRDRKKRKKQKNVRDYPSASFFADMDGDKADSFGRKREPVHNAEPKTEYARDNVKRKKTRKRRRSVGAKSTSVFVVTLLLLPMIGGLLYMYFNVELFAAKEEPFDGYFCLETVPLPTEGQAKYIAEKMRLSGAAGYIAKTKEGYCVAMDMYRDEKTARKKLKEYDNRFCALRIRRFKNVELVYPYYDERTAELTLEATRIADELYMSLKKVADRVQNGTVDNAESIKTLRELYDETRAFGSEFKDGVDICYRDVGYVRILAALDIYISALEWLINGGGNAPNMLCDIRNCYIKIINVRYQLILETGNVIK